MIDPEEQAVACLVPLRGTFAFREFKNFDRMLVGVFEVERLDTGGILVPVGQSLRPRGSVLDVILAEHLIRLVHVADDDSNVLKPKIVAARIGWNSAAAWRKELNEFDRLIAEFHLDDANARSENSKEALNIFSGHFAV